MQATCRGVGNRESLAINGALNHKMTGVIGTPIDVPENILSSRSATRSDEANMKKCYLSVILAALFALTAGCAGNPNQIKIPKAAAKMGVEFSWEGIQACTHESPEIRVSSVPEGTEALRVKLKNINQPDWNQGGGKVKYDGSGVIPAGALTLGYNGPCPPGGRSKYEFSVMAVDAQGVIIGFGKARRVFPFKK
jgi:phosphatidylethanolamine-binding protein (PEBP) family uncharacterized protein